MISRSFWYWPSVGIPEDLEGAERIGRRLAEALRLIQDGGIGWGYPQGDDAHELTLPPDELRRIIEAQRAGLAGLESGGAQREEEERGWRQTTEARAACTSILHQLGGR